MQSPKNRVINALTAIDTSCKGGFVASFAKRLGYAALSHDYRLAPEHPFPATAEDSLAVYRGLLERFQPEDIRIAGESASGGLTLALLFALKKDGLPIPCAAVCFNRRCVHFEYDRSSF